MEKSIQPGLYVISYYLSERMTISDNAQPPSVRPSFLKVKKYLMLLFLFCSLERFLCTAPFGINVNLIGHGCWRLEGIYNNDIASSKPVSPSVFRVSVLESDRLVLDYQYLPVSITSPDCYQYNYNGTQFWFLTAVEFYR